MANNIKAKDIRLACDRQAASVLKKIFFGAIIVYILEFFIMGRLDNLLGPSTEFTAIVGYDREIKWFAIISSMSIVLIMSILKKILIELLVDNNSQ
jgi:hypothetical protein